MTKNIVLCLDFEIESIDCVSYRVSTVEEWHEITEFLSKCSKYKIHPYCCPSPRECTGEELTAKSLLRKIEIIDDAAQVEAFKTFYGGSFFTGCDILDKLFSDYLPDLSLYNSCYTRNIEMVTKLIDLGIDDWNGGLSGACHNGSNDLVQMMIDSGATNFSEGFIIACTHKHYVIMLILAKKGANVTQAVKQMCRNNFNDMVEYLIREYDDLIDWSEILTFAYEHSQELLIQSSLKHGDLNYNQYLKYYCAGSISEGFIIASARGHYNIMSMLAQDGANVTEALKQLYRDNLTDVVEYLATESDDHIDWSQVLAFACQESYSLLIEHSLKHGVVICNHCHKNYSNVA